MGSAGLVHLTAVQKPPGNRIDPHYPRFHPHHVPLSRRNRQVCLALRHGNRGVPLYAASSAKSLQKISREIQRFIGSLQRRELLGCRVTLGQLQGGYREIHRLIFPIPFLDMGGVHEHARYNPRVRPVPTHHARGSHHERQNNQRTVDHRVSTHHRRHLTSYRRVPNDGKAFHLPAGPPTRPQAGHARNIRILPTPILHRRRVHLRGSVVDDHCAGECVVRSPRGGLDEEIDDRAGAGGRGRFI